MNKDKKLFTKQSLIAIATANKYDKNSTIQAMSCLLPFSSNVNIEIAKLMFDGIKEPVHDDMNIDNLDNNNNNDNNNDNNLNNNDNNIIYNDNNNDNKNDNDNINNVNVALNSHVDYMTTVIDNIPYQYDMDDIEINQEILSKQILLSITNRKILSILDVYGNELRSLMSGVSEFNHCAKYFMPKIFYAMSVICSLNRLKFDNVDNVDNNNANGNVDNNNAIDKIHNLLEFMVSTINTPQTNNDHDEVFEMLSVIISNKFEISRKLIQQKIKKDIQNKKQQIKKQILTAINSVTKDLDECSDLVADKSQNRHHYLVNMQNTLTRSLQKNINQKHIDKLKTITKENIDKNQVRWTESSSLKELWLQQKREIYIKQFKNIVELSMIKSFPKNDYWEMQ